MMAHKKQRTLRQHVPNDIIGDILLRLPVKSLMRFTCVCKSWNHLINSSRFMSMHLHHASKDSYRNCNKVILISFSNSFQSLDYEASTAKVEQLDFPLEAPNGLTVLGSCNGLLCIAIHNRGTVLWNPSIRKYKEIPLTLSFPIERSSLYGFGYDSTIDDYKVVKVHCNNMKVTYHQQVEIFTVKSNSWTTVGNMRCIPPFFSFVGAGTLVNGALYWPVFSPPKTLIFRFDLRDYTWILIQLPWDLQYDCVNIKFGDFGGSLCMFERVESDEGYGFRMWTLRENNYERSWIKMSTISRLEEMPSRGDLFPVCITKNGEMLLQSKEHSERFSEVKKKFYLYTPKEKGKFRELQNCGIHVYYAGVTYVESLVSPNSNVVQSFGVREEEKSVGSISE